jgi:alpha-mannosidase
MPQRCFTAIQDGRQGLLVANRGLPEVEVLLPDLLHPPSLAGSEIAITLLRCVGWLSRDDLSTRRGHAGPGLPTSEAQMPGVWDFDYAVIPFSPDQALDAYHRPTPSATWRHNYAPIRPLAAYLHFLSTDNPAFVISAIKPPETGEGWILRGYSLQNAPLQVKLTLPQPVSQVRRVNLDESPGEIQQGQILPTENGQSFTLDTGAFQIATLRLISNL